MVRASSKSATVAAPTPVPAVVETPVVEKAKKAPRAKKAVDQALVVETPAPVVAAPTPAPVVEESAAATEETTVDKSTPAGALLAEIAEFNKNFQAWSNFGNALKANIKNITKISSKVSKNADKSTKRKKNAKSKPSGFEKPTPISDELAVFFGKELGTLMARTDVSSQIHDYVVKHNLQNADNRRIIHPDAKLKQLLNVNNDELTYFNLQKYLKFHFKKEAAALKA
jgi:chromatin remodeling complex protein RSC6